MSRTVRAGLIQATLCADTTASVTPIKQAMLDQTVGLIADAAAHGAQLVCLQQPSARPYFAAQQHTNPSDPTQPIPEPPPIRPLCELPPTH